MRKTAFNIVVLALLLWPSPSPGQYSVTTDGWSFKNFDTKPLPWDIYRDTFIGIPPSYDPLSSAFDVLFYDQLYKEKLSKSGNCFGLSLMSLMMLKNGGHLGFCLPVNQYSGDLVGLGTGGALLGPTEPMLTRAINTMHGHQVNLPTVQLILDTIAQNKNRNGSFAYDSFQNAKLQKDLTLVSITKSLNPDDGGHTIVAYDAQDLGGGNKRIYVYDPNRSWADSAAQPWYTGGQNYVQISGNSWSFTMAGTSGTWSGDPGSGGNILIIPISVTGPHTRSPASLGDQIIGRILNELLLTGSSASIEQVTDDRGKRLFVPGTREIDTSATGMLSMVPWYPSDQASTPTEPASVWFQIGRAGSTLNVSVRAAESGYTLIASGPRGRVTVQSIGGRGTDLITLSQAGTQQPRVALRNGRGDATFAVEFLQPVSPRERLRVLKATRIAMPEGASVELGVGDRSQALNIHSSEAAIRYDLELQNVSRKGIESLSRRGVAQPAGLSQTIRPRDWSRLGTADVLEETLPSRLTTRQGPRAREQTERRAK
ncbi:MAG TPA: hypothetical protein VGL03_14170 [Thermoanaerobaculia bacterium]|jgi:hypothetical protein